MGFQEQRSPGTHPSPVQNGMNSGTSFLSPALFPASLLKQDVAGETHPPFPVFPLNDSAEEHLAAANEWAIPACRAGDADLPAVARGGWQMHHGACHPVARGDMGSSEDGDPLAIMPHAATRELGRGEASATSLI